MCSTIRPNADHALALHRVADDREGFLSDVVIRDDVVGTVVEALVDLHRRHETIDFDRVLALDLQGLDLVVLDLDVDALVDLVAAPLVGGVHRLARLLIDQLLAQAIAGFLVDLAERDALGRCGGRIHRNRAGNQRELQVPLPIRTRRHDATPLSVSTNLIKVPHQSFLLESWFCSQKAGVSKEI